MKSRKPSVAPQTAAVDEAVVAPQALTKHETAYAFSLITALFFSWGIAYGLLDSLNKHFQTVFGITKTKSTFLQVAYFGAYFIWAPFAGLFMRRVGYRRGIYLGLTFYSVSAILYWPVAVYKSYAGFVVLTWSMSMGLSTLEVAANTYITVLGDPRYGAMRLTLSQAFNGVGAFAGPLIASQEFYKGNNDTSLGSVQWVYLAVACWGCVLLLMFRFAKLPEIDEATLSDTLADQNEVEPLHKQYHTIFGFVAQFSYVGAQVALATFATNLMADTPSINYPASKASLWFSYCQMVFALGRFLGSGLLLYVDPPVLLAIYSGLCAVFAALVVNTNGTAAVTCLFWTFFFESICWPTIYALAIARLGKLTKIGGSLVVSGVGGGALFSPLQGVYSDAVSVQRSYWVPFAGYCISTLYGIGMAIDSYRRRNVDLRTGLAKPSPAVFADDGDMMEKSDSAGHLANRKEGETSRKRMNQTTVEHIE